MKCFGLNRCLNSLLINEGECAQSLPVIYLHIKSFHAMLVCIWNMLSLLYWVVFLMTDFITKKMDIDLLYETSNILLACFYSYIVSIIISCYKKLEIERLPPPGICLF